jgi:GR25 family glycosyltransferase involved in LPS biosynthesis
MQQTEGLQNLRQFSNLWLDEGKNAGMHHIKTSDVKIIMEQIQSLEKKLQKFEEMMVREVASRRNTQSLRTLTEQIQSAEIQLEDTITSKKSGRQIARAIITEGYVISSHKSKFDAFQKRNEHSHLGPMYWAIATDGTYQPNLDQWAQIIKKPAVNASHFIRPEQKTEYDSPHAVGCYMSHWNLLRSFQHRHVDLRPDLYFMFEDDASCVPNVRERVLEMTQYLPKDWDMIFLGGKHYSRGLECRNTSHFTDTAISHFKENGIMREICAGQCGIANNPLAPDGTRHLNVTTQPYWLTLDTTDTEAYVINPHRIEHIMMVAEPKDYIPYDIVLAMSMNVRNLSVYIPTEAWCTQGDGTTTLEKPKRHEGYFTVKERGEYFQHWDFLYHEECIGNY